MEKIIYRYAVHAMVSLLIAGCSLLQSSPGVSRSVLEEIGSRDAVAFNETEIPSEILDRLAEFRLVIVGETHQLDEHYEFMAELIRELYGRGFRQLLLEWPQMADWVVMDYINGSPMLPGWTPPVDLHGGLITSIRNFNSTLAPEERVSVRGIDVNLSDYGGANAFHSLTTALLGILGDTAPFDDFTQSPYATSEQQSAAMKALAEALELQRIDLENRWGTDWYDTIVELVEVEVTSISIRSMRDRKYDASVQLREQWMKTIADRRLSGFSHRSIVNVGGNHAQKKRLKGSKIEWLGDYLVHKSPYVGGDAYVISVVPAHLVRSPGAPADDELSNSPDNELFRIMHEMWPDQTVYLPLEDPVFSNECVKINYEKTIYCGFLRRHYDSVLQYPLAHHIPPP